ncbi:MAG: efflux RND transporter periplasmic adaptor subunit, partial [Planctomycetaceae bacterium]|nr:efflux RND transporter periplasmic adaptor subunit [Planctomycetaceae bacterium]
MNDPAENGVPPHKSAQPEGTTPPSDADPSPAGHGPLDHRESQRWWLKLCFQPVLFLLSGALLIAGLGIAQRLGWISAAGHADAHNHALSAAANVTYICPMMCTPPQTEPGRCPVCAMELVPATAGTGPADMHSVHIDPAARRIANIRTVAVASIPLSRTLRSVGELRYNEGSLKTISAYVDGRLEKLYADYTGVVVEKGDHLALLYSPKLYSAQVEYLLSKKARDEGRTGGAQRFGLPDQNLFENARQRLIEHGMT